MAKKVIIIGAGPAGYPCALRLASLGAEITLIENKHLGGVCLNSGCIPSKSLLDGAHKFALVKELEIFSTNSQLGEEYYKTLSFQKLQERRKNTITKLQQGILRLLESAKVKYIQGTASFVNDHEIKVNDEILSFDDAVIATGSIAVLPKIFDNVKQDIFDNSTIFNLESLPKTLTILGGGVIACEFACLMQSLGVQTTIIEMQPTILPTEDEIISRTLKNILTKRGVIIYTSTKAKEIKKENDKKIVILDNDKEIVSDAILAALGRRPNIENLNLQALGIDKINVNPKTLQIKDNIYAIGDVNGLCQLAHSATAQGEVVASRIMGQNLTYDNSLIPSAIYTFPEMASVGINTKKAKEQGLQVTIRKSFLLANGRALAQGDTEGLIQLIEDTNTGKLLGAQIIAQNAGEMIHILSLAIKLGLKTTDLQNIIFAHPTLSESIKDATYKNGIKIN